MKKHEAVDAGRKAGQQQALALLAEESGETLLRAEEPAARLVAQNWAAAPMHLTGVPAGHRDDFKRAFEQGFMMEWSVRHNALPDVKAARRERSFRRKLAEFIEAGDRAVSALMEKLAEDPQVALEWKAEPAFDGVEKRALALRVQAALDADRMVDQAREWLEEVLLSGARFPKRSTSPVSNLMAQSAVAAAAELLQVLRDASL